MLGFLDPMASLEFSSRTFRSFADPEELEKLPYPPTVERLDVNIWGRCGGPDQPVTIGIGTNFHGHFDFWAEIRYAVQDIPIFYTRTIFNGWQYQGEEWKDALEQFRNGERDVLTIGGDIHPESAVIVKQEKRTYTNSDG